MTADGSLKFIFSCFQFFGLFPFAFKMSNGIFQFSESKRLLAYSKVIAIIFSVFNVFLIYHELTVSLGYVDENSSKTVLVLSNVCISLSGILIFRMILTKRKSFCFWMNNVAGILRNLKKVNIKKLTTFFYRISGVIILSVFAAAAVEYFMYEIVRSHQRHFRDFFRAPNIVIFIYYTSALQVKMFVQLFFVFANLLRFYYAETHESLKAGENTKNRNFWLGFVRDLRLRDLLVKDLVDFIHSFFIPIVSLQLLWGFFTTLFNISLAVHIGIPPMIQVLWAAYVFWDIFVVVVLCHALEKEGERTVHYLNTFLINWDDEELRKEIDILSLQLLHRRLEFSALGCKKINLSLLYWMTGTLSSYAVVLTQYQYESPKGKICVCELLRNSSSP